MEYKNTRFRMYYMKYFIKQKALNRGLDIYTFCNIFSNSCSLYTLFYVRKKMKDSYTANKYIWFPN